MADEKAGRLSEEKKDRLVIGILAHVDAGKTTLSEALLYQSGAIRKAGRVDKGDAFLDTDSMEKSRGITIFSKPAEFEYEGRSVTLLDTPGHVDFSPETERTLSVLDLAVLVISAADRVTADTRIIWKLLDQYRVPTFIFVNKMDQAGADRETVLKELEEKLSSSCIDFSNGIENDAIQEKIAVTDDALTEKYLDGKPIETADVERLLAERKVFPAFFGSALKMEGTEELLQAISAYAEKKEYPRKFGARVYKISHDGSIRLTWVKVTGGSVRVRSALNARGKEEASEKVTEIRIYSGSGYDSVQEAHAGQICALAGLTFTHAGDGLGFEAEGHAGLLQPTFTSSILLRDSDDPAAIYQALKLLEEEEPTLHVARNDRTGTIHVQVMGQVHREILKTVMRDRFGIELSFGPEQVVYKETIQSPVEGVGHYEPLRHYAEVHLKMEPISAGSGIIFDTDVSTDQLAENLQRLILSHLEERPLLGVLTGSEITDMKITLIGGRAHPRHTEGGDFRQAAYRAVRQGLMEAGNVLLEPILELNAEIPSIYVGRFMTDLNRMEGKCEITGEENGNSLVTGTVSAAAFGSYGETFASYTGGKGSLAYALREYAPCHNAEEVIQAIGYDADADLEYPSGSVFCSHGAGTYVPWDSVRAFMHVHTEWGDNAMGGGSSESMDVPGCGQLKREAGGDYSTYSGEVTSFAGKRETAQSGSFKEREERYAAAEDELKGIFERTYGADKWRPFKKNNEQTEEPPYEKEKKEGFLKNSVLRQQDKTDAKPVRKRYFLVDGYNIIFRWKDLNLLASSNLDSARDALIDWMADLRGWLDTQLILVFDAYKVSGGKEKVFEHNGIYVVYTKEAETADAYIEKTVHDLGRDHEVTVASSDGLEQVIILGEGASRMSARELLALCDSFRSGTQKAGMDSVSGRKNYLLDNLSPQAAEALSKLKEE
ncbi:MAG: translation factor GTPase family protein [Eubacterium sp.]|nr:translation factor GTPase family protein [Eubacterium sp.]